MTALRFTVVPFVSRVRIGVDRDAGGVFDRDELDAGTSAAERLVPMPKRREGTPALARSSVLEVYAAGKGVRRRIPEEGTKPAAFARIGRA